MLGSFIHREQYSLDLIPFDGDLLSMESESAFKVSTFVIFEEKHCVVLCCLWVFAIKLSEQFVGDPGSRGRLCKADVS